ncbi:hypothetical protein [Hyphomicrobium sp. MC1]|uniref:hypothetical protein n=1 Tax=Hyphomicrobium sp. (strain MC1) TaxID=717785 RepID=UPI000213EB2E|nr:hypothetical protein [Hyphomicrobium sp. MC1]CCB65401.1 membrane protein of unknown function [Hyphomicrobium sp. MC1]
MEDFSNPLTIAILTMIASGLVFVAYNHPKQFAVFFWSYFALYTVAIVAVFILQRYDAIILSRINHSWLSEAEKAQVIRIVKGPPPDREDKFWAALIEYGSVYIGLLGCLPVLGLTADNKTNGNRQRRDY